MKTTKKILSLLLAILTLSTCTIGATVSYASTPSSAGQTVESIVIDGKTYEYKDEMINGKSVTRIINLTDNTEDILYYNEITGIIYLNNQIIATVNNVATNNNSPEITAQANQYWFKHDTTNKRISWEKGVAAAVLAGIIAAVIPHVGKITVIAKIGLSALSTVAAACIGGYVKCVSYTHTFSDGSGEVRCDWTFKPNSGDLIVNITNKTMCSV